MRRSVLCTAILLPCVAVTCVLLGAPPETRTWTDHSGEFNVNAKLLGIKVSLQTADGRTIDVPLSRLSAKDRAYVTERLATLKGIVGKVVSVTDGDTIIVLDSERTQHKIRLAGIDTPEKTQAYGTKASEALANKVFKKTVRVEWSEKDRYQRILGEVYLGDRWINKEMVEEGWAWHYKQYSDSKELGDAEVKARGARAGLWADAMPTPPWEFRRNPTLVEEEPKITQTPTYTPPARAPPRTPDASSTMTHWITNSSGIRHNSGCRYFQNSKGHACSSTAGRACKICGG